MLCWQCFIELANSTGSFTPVIQKENQTNLFSKHKATARAFQGETKIQYFEIQL